jgi:hypothetical protein
MSNSLVPRAPLDMGSLSDPAELGRMLAASGYFSDVKDAAQAVVKVLAGRELGIPAIASMTGVFIVKGRVTLGANLIAALIKRHPKYDLRVVELTNERCEISFLQDGEQIGTSEFTIQDARQAGLSGDNWRHYPRNMLYARAVSNGAKWFVPDVFAGGPVYTPDELGAEVDPETGELSHIEPEPDDVLAPPLTEPEKPKRTRKPKASPEPEPALVAPTTDVNGRTIDEQTGELIELHQPSQPDETPVAPADAVTAGAGTESPAPADGSELINNSEMAKLIEYLDKLEAPQSFRQMAALAADVEDLAQLTKDQAREVMAKAKARYGSS